MHCSHPLQTHVYGGCSVLAMKIGRVHTTALGPEPFRNATGRPCSHLFHCVRSFRNEWTTSRCDRSGTVPERVRLALWCERATGPVPEPFQLPVTFVDSQPILHNISKRSSRHFMASCHRSFDRRQVQILRLIGVPLMIKYAKNARLP